MSTHHAQVFAGENGALMAARDRTSCKDEDEEARTREETYKKVVRKKEARRDPNTRSSTRSHAAIKIHSCEMWLFRP